MKTKFYELIIPQEIKVPRLIMVKENDILTVKCSDWTDEDRELYNKEILDHKDELKSTNPYLDLNNIHFVGWKYHPNIFMHCQDDPISLKNFLLQWNDKYPYTGNSILIHRKHPILNNIRQITFGVGQTNYPIHWID